MTDKAEDNIGNSLIKSITHSDLKHITSDMSEVAIDSFIDDSVIKDIPIIGTISKVYSAGVTISGKIFERKIIDFLIKLDEISLEKRKDFVTKMTEDDKHSRKVGEHLMIILDRMDDMNKPSILAKVLAAFIEEKIDYEMFLRLSSVIDKAFLPDLIKLDQYLKLTGYSITTTSLVNLGLVNLELIDGGSYDENGNQTGGNKYYITQLGEILLEILNTY